MEAVEQDEELVEPVEYPLGSSVHIELDGDDGWSSGIDGTEVEDEVPYQEPDGQQIHYTYKAVCQLASCQSTVFLCSFPL